MPESKNSSNKELFDAILQEKDQRLSEMNEYNRRLDRTIFLYISAAYAAIGLNATDKIDFSALKTSPEYVPLSLLFIFLNGCIILHGVSQSCWAMSLAKFIHVKLNRDLENIVHQHSDSDKNQNLNSVNSFGWDNWRKEIKGLANQTRGAVMLLWILLVLGSSIYSIRLVDLPGFIEKHKLMFYISSLLLISLYYYSMYAFVREGILTKYWHKDSFSLSKTDKIVVLSFPALVILISIRIISSMV